MIQLTLFHHSYKIKQLRVLPKKNFEDLGYTSDISGIKKFYDYVGNFYIVHDGDSDGAENTIETNILFKSIEDTTNLAKFIIDHE